MLKRLQLKDFTVFEKADLRLGALNVFVGENGTGKTHILKAAYCGLSVSHRPIVGSGAESWSFALNSKLMGVFRPNALPHWGVFRLSCAWWGTASTPMGASLAHARGEDGLRRKHGPRP